MRILGDKMVRQEFRQHREALDDSTREVTDSHLSQFEGAWRTYVDGLRQQAEEVVAKNFLKVEEGPASSPMDFPGASKPVHSIGQSDTSAPAIPDFGNKLTREEISQLSPKQMATLLKLNQHIERNEEGSL